MHSAISGLSSSRTALLSSELSSLSSLLNLCSSFLKSLWSFSSTSWDSSIIPRRLARVGLSPGRFGFDRASRDRSVQPGGLPLLRARLAPPFLDREDPKASSWSRSSDRKLGNFVNLEKKNARERESNRVDRGGDRGRKVGRLVALSSLAQMV